jgi:hypothetical protein
LRFAEVDLAGEIDSLLEDVLPTIIESRWGIEKGECYLQPHNGLHSVQVSVEIIIGNILLHVRTMVGCQTGVQLSMIQEQPQ